jgi:signal transduction histidine kinase
VRFTVKDDGPGIPADQQERLFVRFQQLEAANTRRRGGSGLGLAIAHAMVVAHGGSTWIEDTPGGGATVGFRVPIAPARSAAVVAETEVAE